MLGYMEATIKRDGEPIFFREINIEDGSLKGIQPAMLGWFKKLHDDIVSIPQSGDNDECIIVEIEYKITHDAIECYCSQFKAEGKRKYVWWALLGLHPHLHKEIEQFIKKYFV